MKNYDTHRTNWAEAVVAALFFAGFLLIRMYLPPQIMNISEIGWRLTGTVTLWLIVSAVLDIIDKARHKRAPEGTVPEPIKLPGWMQINFFIYCTHYLFIRIVWWLEELIGLNGIEAANIVVYILMPAICIAAAYGISVFMKKRLPKVYSVITGGR